MAVGTVVENEYQPGHAYAMPAFSTGYHYPSVSS